MNNFQLLLSCLALLQQKKNNNNKRTASCNCNLCFRYCSKYCNQIELQSIYNNWSTFTFIKNESSN